MMDFILNFETVIRDACERHGVSRAKLLKRVPRYSSRPYVRARTDVVLALRKAGMTFKEIAGVLNMCESATADIARRAVAKSPTVV